MRTSTKSARHHCLDKYNKVTLAQDLQRFDQFHLCTLLEFHFITFTQPPTPAASTPGLSAPSSAFKEGTQPPTLASASSADFYPPISQSINTTNPGAVQWAATRPTLTGGIVSGRMSGLYARPQLVRVLMKDLKRRHSCADSTIPRRCQHAEF